jgi:hypothetical protein
MLEARTVERGWGRSGEAPFGDTSPDLGRAHGAGGERVRAVAADPTSASRRPGVARALEVLRDEGIRSLAFEVLGETVYRRLALLERALDEPPPVHDLRSRIDLGLVGDASEYVGFRTDAAPRDVAARLDGGALCFVARAGGRIVGATWASVGGGRIPYLGCDLALADDEVYLSDTWVAAGFISWSRTTRRAGRASTCAFPIGFGTSSAGTGSLPIPLGVILGGLPYVEDRLLAVASAYQAVTEGHGSDCLWV